MRLIFIILMFSYLLRRYSFLFYRGKIRNNFIIMILFLFFFYPAQLISDAPYRILRMKKQRSAAEGKANEELRMKNEEYKKRMNLIGFILLL